MQFPTVYMPSPLGAAVSHIQGPGGTHLGKGRVCKAGAARPSTFGIAQIR